MGIARIDAVLTDLQEEVLRLKMIADKYGELIYAVGMKHDGETRHETALRYIRQAENQGDRKPQDEASDPNGHISALAGSNYTRG